jgi:tetratricopeptide (TPR) repeat protein/transglutaminase-like putative cysteine protease
MLRYDAEGASRIFVNGALVLDDPLYRNSASAVADVFAVPATLKAGWNTVLVKMADENDEAWFTLRFTDPKSDAPLKLDIDPTKAAPDAVTAAPPAPTNPATYPVTAIAEWVANTPACKAGETEALFWLGMRQRETGNYEVAITTLKKALEKAPDSGLLRWELSTALHYDEQEDDARAERELARKQNHRIVKAEISFRSEQSKGQAANDRIAGAKATLAINPKSDDALWQLVDAYDDAKMQNEALQTARKALLAAPSIEAYGAYVEWYAYYKRQTEAEAALTKGLARYPHSSTLLSKRAEMQEEKGKTAEAIALYRRLNGINYPQLDNQKKIVELLVSMKARKEAVKELLVARTQRPQNADLCASLADIYREMGDKKSSIAMYKEAIRLDPAQVSLRDKLQVVSGEKRVLDLVPPTPVGPILASIPKPGQMAGVSQVTLLDEGRTVVYPDYAQVRQSRIIITILDAAGAKENQQYSIGATTSTARITVEAARVIKADGKIQDALDNVNRYGVAFPSLAPGDTIDISYRTEDYPRGGLAGKFWGQWTFNQTNQPVKLSRYVLVTPPDMAVNFRGHNGLSDPTTQEKEGWRVREWREADLVALKDEIMTTPEHDRQRWLDISTIGSWKDMVAWYQDISNPRCIPDSVVKAKAEELTKNATTEREKIQAVVSYVAQKIEYQTTPFRLSAFVPTEGRQVLRDSYGDCKDKAALVTAMLAHLGIRSNMVLISPRSEGVTPYLPSPRFSHAIAVVQTTDGPLWVDATADQLEFGAFPDPDQGVPALIIDDATTDLTLTPTTGPEGSVLGDEYKGSLGADGTFKGDVRILFTGGMAWSLRSQLRQVPGSRMDDVLKQVGQQFIENSRVNKAVLNKLEDPNTPLTMDFGVEAESFAQPAGNLLILKFPWSRAMVTRSNDMLLAEKERKQPIEIDMKGVQRTAVRYELPAGYTPQSLKPEVKGDTPFGSYRFSYKVEGGVLIAEREVKYTRLRVAPEEIAQYRAFIEAINKESKTPLVLTKPGE